MSFLRRLSITWQFNLLFLFALGLMVTGTLFSTRQSYRLEINAKKDQILGMDQAGHSIAEYYVAQAQSGAMTTAAAQQAALTAIGAVRYHGGNYIFVYNNDGVTIAHPNKSMLGVNEMNDAGRERQNLPAGHDPSCPGRQGFLPEL